MSPAVSVPRASARGPRTLSESSRAMLSTRMYEVVSAPLAWARALSSTWSVPATLRDASITMTRATPRRPAASIGRERASPARSRASTRTASRRASVSRTSRDTARTAIDGAKRAVGRSDGVGRRQPSRCNATTTAAAASAAAKYPGAARDIMAHPARHST